MISDPRQRSVLNTYSTLLKSKSLYLELASTIMLDFDRPVARIVEEQQHLVVVYADESRKTFLLEDSEDGGIKATEVQELLQVEKLPVIKEIQES
jgi:hypothetical protein